MKNFSLLLLGLVLFLVLSCSNDQDPNPEPEPDIYADLHPAGTVISYRNVLIQLIPEEYPEELNPTYGGPDEHVWIAFDLGGKDDNFLDLDRVDHFYATDSTGNYSFNYQGEKEPFEENAPQRSIDVKFSSDPEDFIALIEVKSKATWNDVYDFTDDAGHITRYIPQKEGANKLLRFIGRLGPVDESVRLYGNFALWFLEYDKRMITRVQ